MQRTFTALGAYKVMVTDPNRNQGIVNLGGTLSVDIPFYIESEIIQSFGFEFEFQRQTEQNGFKRVGVNRIILQGKT